MSLILVATTLRAHAAAGASPILMDFLAASHFIQTARMAVVASPSQRNALCATAQDGLPGAELKRDGNAGHAKVQATILQMRAPANNRNLRNYDADAA